MYLIIEEDYTVSFSSILTGNIRSRCRRGEITLIDVKKMRGMNKADHQDELGEFSDIVKYEHKE